MKRVGIITIFNVDNYGAELQAFALQKKIELIGLESEIINYVYYKNWYFKDSKESAPLVSMSIKERILYVVKYRVINFLIAILMPLFSKVVRNRKCNFASFHKENTKISKTYKSYKTLYTAKMDYDIYVVGSDQVWNPQASSTIEPYFLTFAPEKVKKVAYASSFGVSNIEDKLCVKYKDLLNNLDSISVRESSGVDLVKAITGREATHVIDPTLLLSRKDWLPFMKSYDVTSNEYILIYYLYDSKGIIDLALRISKEKNIPVYRICKRSYLNERTEGIINIADAGPSEFMWLIDNAAYVITSSFHGTAFSINFNKQFFTVLSSKKKNNARMESLVNLVGLGSRLITDDIDVSCVDIDTPVNYNHANTLLEFSRTDSGSFITTTLDLF